MATRAAICIGVNRADGMITLQAAAKGARDVAAWATTQGCDVTLLVDDNEQEVYSVQIFKAIQAVVEAGTYEQLLVYFLGHGILLAPGTEYWLLSGAPQNPNEAVNLLRSVEDARNAGIPHVIFFSDACRSAVPGAPLNGVVGGSIFPNRMIAPQSGEVDVFFATRPGNPAWEVPEAEATQHYRGLFTDCLLKALHAPGVSLVEKLPDNTPERSIITSRRLKPYLEQQVPLAAAAVNIQLTQQPVVRVETASPKYFALVPPAPLGPEPPSYQHDFTYSYRGNRGKESRGLLIFPSTAQAGSSRPTNQVPDPAAITFAREVAFVRGHPGQLPVETTTGFTLIGAFVEVVVAPGWEVSYPAGSPLVSSGQFIRLVPQAGVGEGSPPSGTILLQFRSGTGTLLAILPGFIGVVLVAENRVLNVNYLPALATARYQAQAVGAAEREKLRALVAVQARYGEFNPPAPLSSWLHGSHEFDPTLGLYAAYGYAQRGQYAEVARLQRWLAEDLALPRLFDLELLIARYQQAAYSAAPASSLVPFTPLLAQGWALLTPDNPCYLPMHERLRAHLLPALWTTYTAEGMAIVLATLQPPTTI
jgi:hypothetical protein